MIKVLSSTVHESHGVYRCDECNGKIEIAENYHKNEFTKEKLCKNCFEVGEPESTVLTGGKDGD